MRPIVNISLIVSLCLLMPMMSSAQEKDDIIAQAPGAFSLHGKIYHKHFKDAVPPATGYVTDWENLFTDAQEAKLDSMLIAFEKRTSIQIAVVTIDSSMASREDFDTVTLKIANAWGVGQQAKSNGVVIGISNSLGVMRIQNGEGITARLTDQQTQEIVNQSFLPSYTKRKYYEGTVEGLTALMQHLDQK